MLPVTFFFNITTRFFLFASLKTIQILSLPSRFIPYPNRTSVEVPVLIRDRTSVLLETQPVSTSILPDRVSMTRRGVFSTSLSSRKVLRPNCRSRRRNHKVREGQTGDGEGVGVCV